MARDRANIKSSLLADEHWRLLTHGAQWLYKYLLVSPTLNLCGVADWRPARIAAAARDVDTADVLVWAGELSTEFFIVIDEETEEVLIRSFFRHDGILAQPNPMKGAAREFAAVASSRLRGAISFELRRLREEYPDGVGQANVWERVPELGRVLKTVPIDVRNPSENPSGNPSPTSTSTSTSTKASLSPTKTRETRLPNDWAPTAEHIKRAKDLGVDLMDAVENFRLHAETHDRHAASWNGAFTTWIKKTKPSRGRGTDWALRA